MDQCESRPGAIGHITLDRKQTGAPSAGNPHAGCDVAGTGNGFTVGLVRHSQRKRGETVRLDLRNTAPVLDPTGMATGILRPAVGLRPEQAPAPWGRVEMWRGGLGLACLFPALSSAGASLSQPCSVSTSRSSNRTGAVNASGSRRKHHDFAHEKLRVRSVSRTKPKRSCR
jgi:hypothetical protein